jgi:uncharacterized protein YxjI
MLNQKSFFIREHVGLLKLSDTYDILDPVNGSHLGTAKEKPGIVVHLLRLFIQKKILPTKVFVYEGPNPEDESRLLFQLRRGVTFLASRVDICDKEGKVVGWLKSKIFSMGGAFQVFDGSGAQIAMVKGDWKGWNFRISDMQEKEIGTITKKWAGAGKELFTSADNYMIALEESNPVKALLLLAAGLAIDTVYKE